MMHIQTKTLSIFCVALLFAGCATTTPQQQERWNQTTPVCIGDSDCKVKWAAARDWVQNNAGYRIQIYSDDLIETYNPSPNDPKIAATITKVLLSKDANGEQSTQIAIRVRCANMFGCIPTHDEAITSFNRFVSHAEINDPACYINNNMKENTPRLGTYVFIWKNKAVIKRVCSDSPASRAGIMPNDVVQSVDGATINSLESWNSVVKTFKFDESRAFNLIRNENPLAVVLKLPTKEEQDKLRSTISTKPDQANAVKPDAEKRIESLNRMLEKGLVTKSEYESKKKQIIDEM